MFIAYYDKLRPYSADFFFKDIQIVESFLFVRIHLIFQSTYFRFLAKLVSFK